jgi:valyl-tRNA synthetase
VQLRHGSEAQQRATRRTLIRTLETVLRLLHPIAPFITAELWEHVAPVAGRKLAGSGDTVVTAAYPVAQLDKVDATADAWVGKLKAVLQEVRSLRSEMGLNPGDAVPLVTLGDAAWVESASPVIAALARLADVRPLPDAPSFAAATHAAPVSVVGDIRLALEVRIDVPAEIARLTKEEARLKAEIAKADAQLGNANFVQRAPAAVVEQMRVRLAEHRAAQAKIQEQLERLTAAA